MISAVRDRLAFLHLPKSAGTSYRHAIAKYYEHADIVPWSFDRWLFGDHPRLDEVTEPVLRDADVDLTAYRYMEGHFALPTIERGFATCDVACVLREPRSRLLSHYTFWRSWGPDMHELWMPYEAARKAQLPLLDYLNDLEVAHQTDNLIARLIIGPHPLIPVDGMIAEGDRQALVELGIERLDSLGFVDLLERGEGTFDALEAWFGSPLERVRLNETDFEDGQPPHVADLSDPAALAAVEDRTLIDQQLWLHVARRRGFTEHQARTLCAAAFANSLDRLIERTRTRAAVAERERVATNGSTASGDTSVAPAMTRLVALVRRGPRAIVDRVVAEVRHRRSR